MSGAPVRGPGTQSTASNCAAPSGRQRLAKCRATSSWSTESTDTARARAGVRLWYRTASRPTRTSSSGGSSETDANELAVIPCGALPPTVTTVTPVANVPNARRSRLVSITSPEGPGWLSTPASSRRSLRPDRRRVRLERAQQRLGDPGRHRPGVGSAHARDPLPATGDKGLPALRVEPYVVEAELELGLREVDQAHPDGQLV